MDGGKSVEKRNSVPTVVVSEDTVEDGYFRSLGEDYACIIQVNLPENRVEALHFHPGVQQKYGSIVYETEDYQQMMLKFVMSHADPAERAVSSAPITRWPSSCPATE